MVLPSQPVGVWHIDVLIGLSCGHSRVKSNQIFLLQFFFFVLEPAEFERDKGKES